MNRQKFHSSGKEIESSAKKGHMWSVLLGAGILVFGMIIGACLTFFVVQGRVMRMVSHPGLHTGAMVQKLDRKLNLTEAQREEMKRVLRKHREEFSEIRRQMRPKLAEQMEALKRDVREVLTAEQRAEWDVYIERMRSMWWNRSRHNGRPGGRRLPHREKDGQEYK